MEPKKKALVGVVVAAIVILSLTALAFVFYPLIKGPGVKTHELDPTNAKPATTDINGDWSVVYGKAPNNSAVGFTFQEVLPAKEQITSGSTTAVKGNVKVEDKTLKSGHIEVDMAKITTDEEKRDINVRRKVFETDKYPNASFEVTQDVDLSSLGDNAEVATVTVPGELTIHGTTQKVSPEFKVVRDQDRVILSTIIPINRLDYNVKTHEFIAAKISEQGEINILLTLEK